MNKRLSVVLLSILLAVSAGCSNKHTKEVDARLDSAQSNALSAKARADEAYSKAEQAAIAASQAQSTADQANDRASRMLEKASRKEGRGAAPGTLPGLLRCSPGPRVTSMAGFRRTKKTPCQCPGKGQCCLGFTRL